MKFGTMCIRALSVLLVVMMGMCSIPLEAAADYELSLFERDLTVMQLYALIEKGVADCVGLNFDESANVVKAGDYIDFSELALEKTDENKILVQTAFDLVFFTHPEFFYLHQNFHWYRPNGMIKGIIPIYHHFALEPGAIDAGRAQLDDAVVDAVSEISEIEDPAGKVLALYDYLATRNVYNRAVATQTHETNRHWSFSAYGALVKGDAVCKGLALAMKLMIDRLDDPRLECIVVKSREMDHVWNMVSIDGEWYHLDVNRAINDVPTLRGVSRRSALLISDAAAADKKYSGWQESMRWEMPVCTSRKYEAGWVFQETVLPIQHKDGMYYFVKKTGYRKYALFSADINGGNETQIARIPLYTRQFTQKDGTQYFNLRTGIVWRGSFLYYVDAELNLARFELGSGENEVLLKLNFTPMDSPDGFYKEKMDGVGLYWDAEGDAIVAVSRNTCAEVGRYPIR